MRPDWLAIAALVACAPQPHLEPQSRRHTTAATARLVAAPMPAPPATEPPTPDPVRCPHPYDPDWMPKEEVGEERARSMNERFGLFCSTRALPGVGDPWVREEFVVLQNRAGCTDKSGRIVIPFIYLELSPFAASGVALALQPGAGWVYIDRRHRRIGTALTVDNWPDETLGGYARFQAPNGKIGFLDRERRIVVPARYDAAFPFRNCRAMVCVGCHPLRWSKDAPKEAACTGDAFLIDESGNMLDSSAGGKPPVRGPDWELCGEK